MSNDSFKCCCSFLLGTRFGRWHHARHMWRVCTVTRSHRLVDWRRKWSELSPKAKVSAVCNIHKIAYLKYFDCMCLLLVVLSSFYMGQFPEIALDPASYLSTILDSVNIQNVKCQCLFMMPFWVPQVGFVSAAAWKKKTQKSLLQPIGPCATGRSGPGQCADLQVGKKRGAGCCFIGFRIPLFWLVQDSRDER